METITTPQTTAAANFEAATQRVKRLFGLRKITVKHIEELTPLERDYLAETCSERLREVKGAERDKFLDQIELILPTNTKHEIWEHHHAAISSAISGHMKTHGVMPTKSAIAEHTGLSRQTVAKHIAAYQLHPEFLAKTDQFKLMTQKLLTSVFNFASNGDTKAARLYFEMVGAINGKRTGAVVNEQNNYIQINNTILSQENLKQLSAEQLNQIERIIMNRQC